MSSQPAVIEQLFASRRRLVRDADSTVFRFERGLHDGAQQPLVAVRLLLQEVMRAPTELERLELVRRAVAHLDEVIGELNDLARLIPPPILREIGLAGALTSLAERAGQIPVELHIEVPGRLPTEVEVAAYLFAAEGIANASQHAIATHVRIDAHLRAGQLVMVVADDGRGGAEPDDQSSLTVLGDRAAALGGSLEFRSPRGSGTTLTLCLPVTPAA